MADDYLVWRISSLSVSSFFFFDLMAKMAKGVVHIPFDSALLFLVVSHPMRRATLPRPGAKAIVWVQRWRLKKKILVVVTTTEKDVHLP